MPTLTILAGPNGAGKSYFSSFFIQTGWIATMPVNIDALESRVDPSLLPSDPMRYEYCLKKEVNKLFNELCHEAIQSKRDFSFECNLRKDQLSIVRDFEKDDYQINLIYLLLGDLEISKQRVQIRINEGGHVVGEKSIIGNFREGLENLDSSVSDGHYHHVYLVDNSKDIKNKGDVLTLQLEMEQSNVIQVSDTFIANYKDLLPAICRQIEQKI
ncbi:MAG: hypothetical protein GXY09_07655 [Bacteroidales bacterium]|nr:hypothetical protein [Bacteroidales bacterium]